MASQAFHVHTNWRGYGVQLQHTNTYNECKYEAVLFQLGHTLKYDFYC